MEFIRDGATTPVPFNIIPIPSSFIGSLKKMFKKKKQTPNISISSRSDIEMPPQIISDGNMDISDFVIENNFLETEIPTTPRVILL